MARIERREVETVWPRRSRDALSYKKKMPSQAKAYIALVIGAGTLLSLLAAGSWSSVNLRPFAIYLGLAALASALKVRIPGMEGTISPNFVFLLLRVVALLLSKFDDFSLV